MKILFAIKSLHKTKGGAERVLCLVANGLAERGHSISVLTYDAPQVETSYPLSSTIRRLFLGIGTATEKTTLKDAWQRLRATRRTIISEQPDVVISFMYSSYVLTAFSLIMSGIKIIGSEHIVPAYYKSRPLHFPLLLLSTFFLNKLTVVTDHIITLFPAWARPKLVCAPNPVVLPNTSTEQINRQNIILNVGRLAEQKNQMLLINAFHKIAADYATWSLRIVGDGELRTALQQHINILGLENRITLAPATDAIDLEYRAASIFAMPSLFESFGLVTAEAMRCGLPAVGFAECPGTNEIIQHGVNGLLAAGLNDTESFAAALKELLDNPELCARLAANAPKTVEKYHLAPVLDTWEKIISLVTGKSTICA